MREALVAFAFVVVVVASATSSTAATGGTVVGATVPSATTFDADDCAAGTAATTIGTVLPGSKGSTDGTCTIEFGSSNDTSRLRMFQSDGGGDAMWRPPTGPPDAGVGAGAGFTSQVVSGNTWGTDVAYDPTIDRYYVVGRQGSGGLVARYRPDGTLDPTWSGVDGWLGPAMGGGTTDSFEDIVVLPDGKLLVTGRMFDAFDEGDFLGIARVDETGQMDSTFGGGDGWVKHNDGNGGSQGHAIAVQADGATLLCGSNRVAGSDSGTFVARLLPDGSFDPGFGDGDATPGDGITFVPFGNAAGVTCEALSYDEDTGNIYAAGRCMCVSSWDLAAWRLLPDGTPDPAWSGDGVAHVNAYDNYGHAHDAELLVDGRYVMVGSVDDGGGVRNGAAVMLRPDGTPDPDWGNSGVLTFLAPGSTDDEVYSVTALSDGALWLSGSRRIGDTDGYVMGVTPDGDVDTEFGTGGFQFVSVHATDDDYLADATWGRDGQLVAVGTRETGTDRLTFAAFDGTPVSDYGAGATWLGADEGAFGACMVTLTNATGTGWSTNACLTSADGAQWHDVPDDSTTGSVATTATTVDDAEVTMRFGMRALPDQPPGSYYAPITFELVAPESS